ncbi:MAG: Tetratricopeptide TPR_2 repeat-containing protein [candidate division TM6 bacterium GW2011_GWF2_33_332]|nr:MAG: Tetratricopeptide TPR_2 repeat-containing protein [candidate division TM6 bacterium GW2011_GWF2_33_332]
MKKKVSQPEKKFKPELIYGLVISICALIVYFPGLKNGLLNWDDNIYVTTNEMIKSPANLDLFFGEFFFGNYHPLTLFSYSIIYHFSELDPYLYHLVNIVFHVVNSLLVFYLVFLLFKNINLAFIVAILFTVHPMHVESVAWISELKDVQYTFFFLLSLIFYIKHIRQKSWKFYSLSVAFFVLSLLTKGQAVTLFVVLLLIDFIEKNSIRKNFTEKIPFLLLSVGFGIIAVIAQKSDNTISDFSKISFFEQTALASYGFTMYVIKTIFPFDISAFYPYPTLINGKIPVGYWYFLSVVPVTIAALYFTFKKNRMIFYGLAFFIINIFLLLQIIPVGNCIMADRYSYIPSIGLYLIIGHLFIRYFLNSKFKYLFILTFMGYLLFLGNYTLAQTKNWKNDFTLWNSVLEINPDIPTALVLRGYAYNETGEYNKALVDLNRSISIDNKYGMAYLNRGVSKARLGYFKESLSDFQKALDYKIEKRFLPELYVSWGGALANTGDLNGAMECFTKSIELNPKNPGVFNNRGITYGMMGKNKEALDDFNMALKLDPKNVDAMKNKQMIIKIINNGLPVQKTP